jgi:inorganic pyrophosphatase
MHPWHDVKLGKNYPEVVQVVIELPKDFRSKYAMDSETGMLRLKYPLLTAARIPANCGFFPQTIGADQDPLDVLVISDEAFLPMSIAEVRIIGGITTSSPKKGNEEKIIALLANDSRWEMFHSLDELPSFRVDEIIQYFETYKALESDHVKVVDRFDRSRALRVLQSAHERYRRERRTAA